MSIALMTLAFKTSLPSTQKFVLVALCDSANDQGECYPSVLALAEKCSLGERTVQEAIAALVSAGHARREFRKGRSTVYWLTPTPAAAAPQGRSSRTPAAAAPVQEAHPRGAVGAGVGGAAGAPTPADCAPPPPQIAHPGGAAGAPITVNEPSIEPPGNQKTEERDGLFPELPAAFDPDADPSIAELVAGGMPTKTAADFIAYKAKAKAPLTRRAWIDHKREAEKAGWSVTDAADKVMAKSWKGFEAKYVASERPPAPSKHAGFAAKDYRQGVAEDGIFA